MIITHLGRPEGQIVEELRVTEVASHLGKLLGKDIKKLDEVFVPGLPVPLNIPKKTKALKLLQRIRDEAHRFAITYQKKLRKL